MKYLGIDEIKSAFAEHLMIHVGYSQETADAAVAEFPDHEENIYLYEEFIEFCEIDDEEFEKCACCTLLSRIGIKGVPMFRFYTYNLNRNIILPSEEEYVKSRRLFQIDELNSDDFPSSEDELVADSDIF